MRIHFWTIFTCLSAVIGFWFSMEFQGMAYWWGSPKTLIWYWVGAGCSYLFSITAIGMMFGKVKELAVLDILIRIGSGMLVFISFSWTTFIIIAGQSGM